MYDIAYTVRKIIKSDRLYNCQLFPVTLYALCEKGTVIQVGRTDICGCLCVSCMQQGLTTGNKHSAVTPSRTDWPQEVRPLPQPSRLGLGQKGGGRRQNDGTMVTSRRPGQTEETNTGGTNNTRRAPCVYREAEPGQRH